MVDCRTCPEKGQWYITHQSLSVLRYQHSSQPLREKRTLPIKPQPGLNDNPVGHMSQLQQPVLALQFLSAIWGDGKVVSSALRLV